MADFRAQIQESLGSSYTIERELGGGGMSRVFVARDGTLRRDVVVKVLPPDLIAGVNVERFRREILMAAGLQHPHIVPVLASGEMDGVPWFTMPFVQGESLRQRLTRGPLPINEAVAILREIAKALAYAHERGVVHRDIKPDNVLLTGGTAVVTDFGIAKALSASRTGDSGHETRGSLTQVGVSIGTPMYMAPEQAAADPNTDARADIYSFGCVAYELLCGHPPFVGMPPQRLLAAHMSERPTNIADLRRDTPPVLAELVMQCLEKDPGRRPNSASDVVRLLDVATTTSGSAEATSAVLLRGRVPMRMALAGWAGMFLAAWILAKAAIVGIGLPSWVLPGALIVAGLGLPAILFTAYVQRVAHKALTATPTLTPGGTPIAYGTMATIAVKASPHVSWRRTLRAGMMAFGAFVLLVGGFMVLRALGIGPAGSLLASGRITAREPVLVADFVVRNGDSTLAGVVSEALRASLSQSSAITLVSPATVAGALQRMQRPTNERLALPLARDLAQREGIKAIVDGDVAQLGTGYVVTVRLVTADSGVVLASVQKAVDGPKELIAAADVIGRELRGKIGESLRSVQNAPSLAQVTTPSIEALRLYSEGARAYDLESDHQKAIARLSQAVTIDTAFAMAWRKLGSVYNAAGYPAEAADSVLAKAFKFRDRLTPHERLATEGSYYYSGPGRNRGRAAAAYEQMLAEGDSVIAANNLGLIEASRRRYARAESLFRANMRVNHNLLPYINILDVQSASHRPAAESASYVEGLKTFQTPAQQTSLTATHASVLASAGQYDAAERLADSVARAGVGAARIDGTSTLMLLAAIRGRIHEVPQRMAALRRMTQSRNYVGAAVFDSASIAFIDAAVLDQPARAVKRLDAALAATPMTAISQSNRDYDFLARAYAAAGRPDRARALVAAHAAQVRDTARLRYDQAAMHRSAAAIAMAEKDYPAAIREYWKSDTAEDGLPSADCNGCAQLGVATAYDRMNQPDSAIAHLERFLSEPEFGRTWMVDFYARGPATRRLGELYEAKGDRAKAAHYYGQFVDLWKNADPELQPQVADVKKRLARLSDTEKR